MLQKEALGFICNRLQMALYREVCNLVMSGVCTVEDADKAVTFGPGIRWGIMGPSLVFELGGGAGGVSGLMNHLNDSISLWLGDMADWKEFPQDWAKVAQEGVNAELANRSPETGNTHQSLEEYRDAMLIQLLKLHIVISLVAFVSGSAYGIFFAANAPNAASVTVREAVETLTAEYRDRLEEISETVQHDRQDITANDDVYYIRWQDVLAVFSSYVAGSEQGAPVAALTENQVDKLREIMWAMNAVDYSTRAETAVIETTDKNGKVTTTEITETVLVISLTHKTPDEMAADYHFTTRQNTYLQLLQDPQYEERMKNLPREIYIALREGNWDYYVGQYFTEFKRELHVVRPFEIPAWWRRYVAIDYGLDMLAAYWIAVDENDYAVVYREVYQPDLIIPEAAKRLLNANGNEDITAWFAPKDLWNRRQETGKSVSDLFAEYGLYLSKVSNGRVAGWYELKRRLQPVPDVDGTLRPKLQIFDTCLNLIRTLPGLQHNEKNPNDTATEPHELTHGPDAIRYFCDGCPLPADLPGIRDEDYVSTEEETKNVFGY